MDFLNKTYSQFLDLFRTMTAGMRITAGLLLVLIATSLIYLFVFQAHTGTDYLFGAREFSQDELHAMQSAFALAQLNDSQIVGYRIRVPRRKRHEYLQALTQSKFTPENFDSAIDEALSSSSSWFESRQLREIKVQHATQKKLARVISAINGIERATVQYHEERSGGYPSTVDKQATIAVAATGRRPLDDTLVRAVRTAASGWFGVSADNVVVIDLILGRAYKGTKGIADSGSAATIYADTKRVYEKMWKEMIYERLAMYPGVVAAVNVQLENETDNETQKVTYDPQSTAVESNSFTKTSESQPPAGGRPGAVPNRVPSNAPREINSTASVANTSEENRENQVSVAGHEQTISKKAPLPPRQVTASIGVPKSYFVKVWEQRNPQTDGQAAKSPDPAELRNIEQAILQDIQTAVVNLLPPLPAGTNPFPQVEVSSFDDPDPEIAEEPSTASLAMLWLVDNWQTLALLALGAASLVMLRGMVRSTTTSSSQSVTAASETAIATSGSIEDNLEETLATILPRRDKSGEPSLRDELAVLVKDSPDAAANVLRTWIGEVQ